MPSQWLLSTTRTLLGLKLHAVIVMRAVLDDDDQSLEEVALLDGIADKHHQLKRAVSVIQFILRFNREYRSLPNSEQRMNTLKKFIRGDYQTLRKQLVLKANNISQGLKIEENKNDKIFSVSGRYNYTAILLA